ncbi:MULTISPECIES: hypothetical protein [Allobacillus]|uniref:hypothetical protein n=1 Tax=Allobacillus TaxID=1400133 RepID=UPI00164355AB|nr:hypothetical protein [Allobacillus salarius]
MILAWIFTLAILFFVTTIVFEHRKGKNKDRFMLSGYYAMAIASVACLIIVLK